MAVMKLFAVIREAAGVSEVTINARNLRELLQTSIERYGDQFERSLPFCKVAVNGVLVKEADFEEVELGASDEVALLPPVSGG